jgi:methyl-accepting chemotaxis protein
MDRRLAGLLPDAVRQSYLRQFGTAVVVILVLLLIVLGGVYAAEQDAQKDAVREGLATNTERNAAEVANWRDQHVSTARVVSQSSRLRVNGEVSVVTTLQSMGRSMPNEVVGIHLLNWQNDSIAASSVALERNGSERFPWLESADFEDLIVGSVVVSDGYRVDNETRIAFLSGVRRGVEHAVAIEVSVDESFSFREPVDGARTRILHRNATVLYGESAATGSAYDGPARETLVNASRFHPSMLLVSPDDTGGNATLTTEGGTVASHAAVPGARMAVVTTASTSAFAVGTKTKAYLGLVFLFVALSLGVVGFVVERPISRSISRLADRTQAIEDGDLDVDLETHRQDEVGTLYRTFASMRDSLADRIGETERAREEARSEAEAARREAEAAKQEAEAFSAHLEETADEYGETIRACADGDLTRRLDPDDESEAMAEIATAFNATMADLERMVAQVRTFAEEVADSTARATTTTERARETGADLSDAAGGISESATEQDDHLSTVTEEMNDLSATVQEVAATADTVADLSAETEQLADDGSEAASVAMSEMETIESATAETAAEIRSLDEEVDQVAEIATLIGDIADQTNTLALNASIEAARAGEEGEGFAVVADEVKGLAEQTREATEEIDDLLGGLSERTGEAVEDMESMRADVVDGVETTEDALDALDEIATQVHDTNQGVQEISDAADDQAQTAQSVVSLTDRVAEISDRTADRADDLAATASDQVTDLDDVARNAETIEQQAADLQELLATFTVENGGTVATSAASAELADASGGNRAETDGGER